MTAPKFIIELATQITDAEMKKYDWMTNRDGYIKENTALLMDVRKALLSGRYYTGVLTVSKSGMSRTIKIAYIKNGRLHNVGDAVMKLAGCDAGGRITGCGMDMLFHAQYNLFRKLCPNHRYQDRMKHYKSL